MSRAVHLAPIETPNQPTERGHTVGYDLQIEGALTAEEQALYEGAHRAFSEACERRSVAVGLSEPAGTFDPDRAAELLEANADWISTPSAFGGDLLTIGPRAVIEAQAVVNEAYEALGRANVGYFRLNIHGMSRYRQAMAAMRMLDTRRAPAGCTTEWTPDKPTGIPVDKLCSNDGWLVTPAEIRAALASYGTLDPRDEAHILDECQVADPEYWGRWIDYLRRAADRGGFRVR